MSTFVTDSAKAVEFFRDLDLPSNLNGPSSCEEMNPKAREIPAWVRDAFVGFGAALNECRNAEDLCGSRVRVLTWAILFEQSASRTCAELTKLKVGMAKSAVLATKQRPLGALLGAYKAEEPAQCNDEYSAKRTNLPPRDIESWSRTGNVVGGTGMGGGTALIVGSASLAFLLVATPAAPLGLGILVAGGLAGIVCATGASVVGMIADGQGDKELSAWKEAIRSGGTDSMGMAEYSIDGVMVGLTWEQRKDLVAKMFSLARPQTAGRTGYSLTNLAVMWYACRENFPTFLDRIRIDFAQSAKFWSLTELEAASLSYGTEKGLRVD